MNDETKEPAADLSAECDKNYEALKATIDALGIDYAKFREKRVKIAGSRVRNNLLNCKKICDSMRKQVLKQIQELPTKPRKTRSVSATDIKLPTPVDSGEVPMPAPVERQLSPLVEVALELSRELTPPQPVKKRRVRARKTAQQISD